jgi:hypothetical protein
VRAHAQALPQLPAFFKAKFYTHLGACQNYDEFSMLSVALSWIENAKSHVTIAGVISEEIEYWHKTAKDILKELEQEMKAGTYEASQIATPLGLGSREMAPKVSMLNSNIIPAALNERPSEDPVKTSAQHK